MEKTMYINCKVGIYDTSYKMSENKDGSITVKIPFIKWTNNTGRLEFDERKISDIKTIRAIKKYFENDELVDDYGMLLEDYIYA